MAKLTPKKKQNLKRIRRFIRSAEKRGYEFSQELKENLITFSTQKLKALTPKKLYEQAKNRSYGEELTGTQARKIERTLSAKKGAETKRQIKEARERREWEQIHSAYVDNVDLTSYEDEYIPSFTDIVLSSIEEYISNATNAKWEVTRTNGYYLQEALRAEIHTYGRDKVAQACEEAPDQIKVEAEAALMSSSTDESRIHATALVMLITSNIPTIKDSEEYTEALEWLETYNADPFNENL